MDFWKINAPLALLSSHRTGCMDRHRRWHPQFCPQELFGHKLLFFDILYCTTLSFFFNPPKGSGGQVVGLPRQMVRLLMRDRIQLTQAIKDLLQNLTVKTDQVGEQADQHDLKADDQQNGREDQRLHVSGALLECKVV